MLVIAGIAVDASAIGPISRQFARLTQRYRHGESRPHDICSDLQSELIKGAEVRRAFRSNMAAAELKEQPLLDSVLSLLRAHEAKLYGVVMLKEPGTDFDGRAVYGQGLTDVVTAFHRTLECQQTNGTVIADFREAQLNGRVSADLMTAKLGPAGDQLPRLLYAPTFGNSEVHAPLQLVDLVGSAVLWPSRPGAFGTGLRAARTSRRQLMARWAVGPPSSRGLGLLRAAGCRTRARPVRMRRQGRRFEVASSQ